MSSNEPTPSPYQSPQHSGHVPPQGSGEGDSTGGLIPYKNAPALIGYYLAVFSLIPCIGLLLSVPAVILGIVGLVKKKQNPAVKGTAHAWVAIILGGITTLLWGGGLILGIIGGAMG